MLKFVGALLGVFVCLPVWSGMKEQEEAEPLVQMWIKEVCVGSVEYLRHGDKNLTWSPVELSFTLGLDMPAPFCLGDDDGSQRGQELEVTDDQGNILAPAVYSWDSEEEEDGVSVSQIILQMKELPPSGISFLNLKGDLRISVVCKKESPVYVLPLKEEASMQVPLPDEHEDWQGVSEDIVVAEESRQGTLAIKQVRRIERDGKHILQVKVELRADIPWAFADFQFCDAKGDKMNTDIYGSGSERNENSWGKSRTLEFEDHKGLDQLGIRLIYTQAVKRVLVPVDLKVGVRGEVPKVKSVP